MRKGNYELTGNYRDIVVSMDVGPSFIYVISAPNGMVKIGISFDPAKRLRSLATGSPVPLTLERVFPVKRKALTRETEIHERMAARRSHGEWFKMTVDDAIKIIEGVLNWSDGPNANDLAPSIVRHARTVCD